MVRKEQYMFYKMEMAFDRTNYGYHKIRRLQSGQWLVGSRLLNNDHTIKPTIAQVQKMKAFDKKIKRMQAERSNYIQELFEGENNG